MPKSHTKFETKPKCIHLSTSTEKTYCKTNGMTRGYGTYGCPSKCQFFREVEKDG